jgi:hypothetical protein
MARRSPGSGGSASERSEAVSEPPESSRDARGASSRGGPASTRSNRSGPSKTGAKSNEGSVSALDVSHDPSSRGTFRSRDVSAASPRERSRRAREVPSPGLGGKFRRSAGTGGGMLLDEFPRSPRWARHRSRRGLGAPRCACRRETSLSWTFFSSGAWELGPTEKRARNRVTTSK